VHEENRTSEARRSHLFGKSNLAARRAALLKILKGATKALNVAAKRPHPLFARAGVSGAAAPTAVFGSCSERKRAEAKATPLPCR